jgi:hypothetical protein
MSMLGACPRKRPCRPLHEWAAAEGGTGRTRRLSIPFGRPGRPRSAVLPATLLSLVRPAGRQAWQRAANHCPRPQVVTMSQHEEAGGAASALAECRAPSPRQQGRSPLNCVQSIPEGYFPHERGWAPQPCGPPTPAGCFPRQRGAPLSYRQRNQEIGDPGRIPE